MSSAETPHEVHDFEADVVEASRELPVLVDFWAEWCGPCRILGPILEKLAAESGDRWRLAKVDTERFPEEASRYGVRGIPNVQLFVDGAPIGEFVGALPEAQVRDWLRRMLPSDVDRAVASALAETQRLLEEGRASEAAKALDSALAAAPEAPELRLQLARVVVFDDPARAEELLAELEPDASDRSAADAVLHFARLLGAASPEASETTEPERHYREALQKLRGRDFEGAFEGLLEVLRQDSETFREEAGKTCVALFQYLGPSHPLVHRFRSEVAGALYR